MFDILTPALLFTSLLTWLPICTQAHMQMSSPYPIRSPLDPDLPWYEKDYDMTSPLFSDGSNFACKHYQLDDDSYGIKATYVAGGTYQMSVAGTASHMGGSCQLSLSYDNGHSFKVIKSIIGGCPLSNSYSFTIPSNAPSSETVLFSWSWFNIVGNREMYQNCARVKVINNPSQRYKRDMSWKRQYSPLTQLPDMFVCNVGNGCTTIEQREVVFPDPGDDVSYGTDSITPDPGPGFVIDDSGASSSTTDGSTTSVPSVTSEVVDPSTTTTHVDYSERVNLNNTAGFGAHIDLKRVAFYYTTRSGPHFHLKRVAFYYTAGSGAHHHLK
ncbi:hypothetical protein PV10_04609 [Exophiala mesophila]|uniref:Chitin-binding type-4 domain-containing protein n=1 Tax=Exophiala mesophila TaxID=212818 RepID=A0A0D1XYT4_EXOME|nr:uncharacterized protein PV10_04609 [Exophiala mesophila]KIV93396.1 hypothetical protein PV10_04609 [Exophiala mesophila]